jgi:hypothetical protein
MATNGLGGMLAAAGAKRPTQRPFDGVVLLPSLTGARHGTPHSFRCRENRSWLGPRGEHRPSAGRCKRASRKGGWRLIRVACGAERQLLDFNAGRGEQQDLAAARPGVLAELTAE